MLWAGILTGGIWSALTMDTAYLPEFTVPGLTVIAPYTGLPAAEIREMVTIPLEDSLSSVSGLQQISSISRDGLCIIELEFPWGTDRTEAGIRTREAIDIAWQRLPSDAPKPQVMGIDPGDIPIITLGVFPENSSLTLVKRLADHELRSSLQQVSGVGSIQVSGGLTEEVHVDFDPAAAAGSGIGISEIYKTLENANIEYPAGTVTEGSTDYLVKTFAESNSLAELEKLHVSNSVQLKDVADLSFGTAKQNSVFFFCKENQKPEEGIRLQVRCRDGFSPAEMAANLKKDLSEIRKRFSGSMSIEIISDRSTALKRSITELLKSLFIGSFFAFAVILFFMRNLSKALILLVSLPASLLTAVLLLHLTGHTLNLMSIGGLAIGVGMVVDNAIVVIERLDRHPSAEPGGNKTAEIISGLSTALCGATLTTIIVFTPLLIMKGLMGSLFSDLGLSVIFSLASSLIVSLTLIPVLYVNLCSKIKSKQDNSKKMRKSSVKIVKFILRNPLRILIAATVLISAGLIPIRQLPFEVISPVNEGVLTFTLGLPQGSSIASAGNCVEALLPELIKLDGIESIAAWAGGETSDPYYLSSTDESAETIQFLIKHPLNTDTENLKSRLKEELKLPGTAACFNPPEDILGDLIGMKENLDWVIEGDNPEALRRDAVKAAGQLSDAKPVPARTKTQIQLHPDRYSLSVKKAELPEISRFLSNLIRGAVPAYLKKDDFDLPIRLRGDRSFISSEADILQIDLPRSSDEPVRLSSVLHSEKKDSLPFLLRENRKDIAVLRLNTPPLPGDEKILTAYNAKPRSVPVLISRSDEIKKLLLFALALLYLCLGIQFESFSIPLLLMLCIPPGISGIIAANFLSAGSLNLNSALGIMVVMGISVNNGILLYEEHNRLLIKPGSRHLGAVYRGTVSRIRPILLTNLTTLSALLPIAFDPNNVSSQASLAVSVIGGLTVTALISVVFIPNIIKITGRRRI